MDVLFVGFLSHWEGDIGEIGQFNKGRKGLGGLESLITSVMTFEGGVVWRRFWASSAALRTSRGEKTRRERLITIEIEIRVKYSKITNGLPWATSELSR